MPLRPSPADQRPREWRDYGGGPDNSKFSTLKQINKSNVAKLDVAWTYPYGETMFNPIVAHGVDLRQRPQQFAGRAGRRDREGDLDSRRARRASRAAA